MIAAGVAGLFLAGTSALAAAPATLSTSATAKKNVPPNRPVVKGPHATRDRTPTYKFFSTDPDGKVEALRVWCGFDIVKLHRCGWQWTPKRLRPGSHVLRVRVVDGRGAGSPVAVVRVAILR